MDKIYVNSAVRDAYERGMPINEAIYSVFGDVLKKRVDDDKRIEKLTPLQVAMMDAGISKYSHVGDIMNASSSYTTNGASSNEWLFPVWTETTLRESNYSPNIIQYITTNVQGVDSNVVKSASLNMLSDKNKKSVKRARVAELADLPLAKIQIGEKAISLWKHGRAIQMSYESVRRVRVNIFARHIASIAKDIGKQDVDWAVDTLVNGDGNDGTDATSLGNTASATTITNEEIIGFLYQYWFDTNTQPDTIIAPRSIAQKILSMSFDTQLGYGASARFTFSAPQFASGDTVILAADVPKINSKDAILVFNRNDTLIKYIENGSMIQEADNFIHNQSRMLTISENSGYAISVIGNNKYIQLGS